MRLTLLLIAVIAAKAVGEEELDVAFVADGSRTICDSDQECQAWIDLRQFYKDLAAKWEIGPDHTQVAFATFCDAATVNWYLNEHEDSTSLDNAIGGVKYCGGELKTQGLVKTIVAQIYGSGKGERDNALKVVVVVSDGAPYIDEASADAASKALQAKGIKVFVVGVTDRATEEFAKGLASPETEGVKTSYHVNDYSELSGIVDDIAKAIGSIKARK